MRTLLSLILLAGFALPAFAQTPTSPPSDKTRWVVTAGYHSVSTPDDGPAVGAEYRISARRSLAVTLTSSSAQSSGDWFALNYADAFPEDRTIDGASLFYRSTDTRSKALRLEHRWTYLPDDTVHPFATLGLSLGRTIEQQSRSSTQVGQVAETNAIRGLGDTESMMLSIGALGSVGTEWSVSNMLSLRISGVIGFGYGRVDETEQPVRSESLGDAVATQTVRYKSTQPLLAFELSAAFRL